MAAPLPPEQHKQVRTTFTNAQRLEICAYKEQNPSVTQSQLATWAQETFELPRKPSQAMISKLLKRKLDLENMTTEELVCKSRRTVRFPKLDVALARWVAFCEESGVPVTGESIRVKAARFAEILEIDTPLTFSNGWLYKFNERHGFGGQRATKDSKESMEQAAGEVLQRLRDFEPRDVFSMDEMGLLFTMFPDRNRTWGAKRLTIGLTCNSDGSEKLPPLFIGKAEKPRGFTNSTALEMNYLHNANGLMTREIFSKWLKDVDSRFREQQRKCLLVVDSVAIHAGFDAGGLSNVEVIFLPPGTPVSFQPLAAGIVPAFKKRYRRRQIQHALDQLDADADVNTVARFDSVGVKQAMSWCIECWNAVPSVVIRSSWHEAGLVPTENVDIELRREEDAISEELSLMLSWLHVAHPLTVEDLVSLPEESVIMDVPTDEDFCTFVESVRVASQQPVPKAAVVDGDLSVEELKEHLKWIAKLLIYADEKGVSAESVSGMRVLQRDFRDKLNKKQFGRN
ncbi:Tigger transposable element-derived protein 6 [Phytophthora citrophthora]|uniref:Tigger transposable element-derived protein 6 n=1 Tax=Phytophthora citrophthora TaxID=4793 RepID=A0AAD9GSY3_9STRA|nr:Tigger transposable element-derived protein 6 [Phytophthora citrophthora]